MADTIGNYGVSDTSAVRVVSVVAASSGVSETFQLVLAPDPKPVLVTGAAPTVS
jgi:hypothetical protein